MRFFCICRCSDFAVIQQPYTLVRFHAGCVGSRRRILSLEANRNYSAYLASHASQDASSLESGDLGITVLFHQPHFVWERESLPCWHRKPPALADWPLQLHRQIYFTSRTLSGNMSPFPVDTGSRHPLPTGPCGSVAKFISPAALCLGTRVSSLMTPEAAMPCQLAFAAPSPDLFHQPHFVWEQESLRL